MDGKLTVYVLCAPIDCGQFGIDAQLLLCAGETEQAIVSALQKHVSLPPAQDGKSAAEQAAAQEGAP